LFDMFEIYRIKMDFMILSVIFDLWSCFQKLTVLLTVRVFYLIFLHTMSLQYSPIFCFFIPIIGMSEL